VDNDSVYLSLVAEFLTGENYNVLTAENPYQARQLLNTQDIDLALIDVRLLNDDDIKDRAGLNLARDVAPHVPKIIVTRIDTAEYARAALKPNWNGQTAAVDFILKTEGLEVMLTAVRQTLLTIQAKPDPPSIPAHLQQQLQSALESCCASCRSNDQLHDIFAHEGLSQWQYGIPQHRRIDRRIQALIPFLWQKRTKDNKNGLVLFLSVLAATTPANDACNPLLLGLAKELDEVAG
jgi:DNA-binding LytR/AlgR family response regulator